MGNTDCFALYSELRRAGRNTDTFENLGVLHRQQQKMADDGKDTGDTPRLEDMSLLSITDGENERGIPFVKFIDDVEAFARTFSPPATAEVLIGAYSELHSKFKTFETSLGQKSKSPFYH